MTDDPTVDHLEADEDTPTATGIVVPVPEGTVPDGEIVYAESVEAAQHWDERYWRNGWR